MNDKAKKPDPPNDGGAGLRACIAPLDDELFRLCGKVASQSRVVEGIRIALCDEHVAEYDKEQTTGFQQGSCY